MKPFIHSDFLLETPAARRLFHEVAASAPIIDYHSHLPPEDIATNRRFDNLFDMWLAGDHYKWRAMRALGTPERLCTGDADPYEKFLAWARALPRTLRNPLYHWSHLELKRYFDIDELLDETTAPAIWERANARLADDDFTVHALLSKFQVEVLCTTDDPIDDLRWHREIAGSECPTQVFPTFRPDKVMKTEDPAAFNQYLDQLAAAADVDIGSLDGVLTALKRRHDGFHEVGCRLSDHGLTRCFPADTRDGEARRIFDALRAGNPVSIEDQEAFAGYMMVHFGRWDAEKGWTKQLHLGALRNTRTRLFQSLGPDIGCDSLHDGPQAEALARYIDRLDQDGQAPKMIVYNVNPADNYVLATTVANFNDGAIAGKMQFGSGWWHLDQEEGMRWQLNALSAVSALSTFVGMLTDSRSFLSFCRHEYFRRILCDVVGSDIERGAIPDVPEMVDGLVRDICYENAKQYFNFPEVS